MRRGHWVSALLALGIAPSPAFAAAALEVSAALSERRVAVGDVVTLEVTAVSTANGEIEIDIPELEAMAVLSRSQSESTSISWTGAGQSLRREHTLRIELEAQKPGPVTISNIIAHAGGDSAQAAPVSLEIIQSGQSDESAAPAAPAGTVSPPTPEEQKLFVRYRADKTEAHVGEQILLDLEIFTAGSFNLDESKPPPTLDGFWREVIDAPTRLNGRVERVAGREFHVYRLWRIALFPIEAGSRTIPALPLNFSMNRSIFSTGQRIKRSAPAIKLEILPLPNEGRPKDFASTNVGEYTLSAKIDSPTVPAGKAVVLDIAIAGSGNIKSIKLPELPAVDGFRVFPPTIKDTVTPAETGISGSKEAEILLMPTRAGRLEIPPLELAIYRPSKKSYERLRTESFRIAVEGDPTAAANTGTSVGVKEPIAPADNRAKAKLRPIRFRSALIDRRQPIASQPALAGLMLVPPFLFALALLLETLVARLKRETPGSQKRRALRAARERLAAAEAAAKAGHSGSAYAEISEVLLAYGTAHSGIALRGLTHDEGKAALLERGASPELAEALTTELERCEHARFAPGGQSGGAIDEAIARARALLAELDGWTGR